MPRSRRLLCLAYAAIAVLALVGTWTQNVAYFCAEDGPVAGFVLATGRFWAATLAEQGARARARHELAKVASANRLGNWEFNEWLHGTTHSLDGMPGQSWNAAAFLLACACVEGRVFSSWGG